MPVADKAVDSSEQDCEFSSVAVDATLTIDLRHCIYARSPVITLHPQSPIGSPKDDTYREFFDTYMEIDPDPSTLLTYYYQYDSTNRHTYRSPGRPVSA